MDKLKVIIFQLAEVLLFPLTIVSAVWCRFITTGRIERTILAEKIFMAAGVLPIRDHYYQPLIKPRKHLKSPLSKVRDLPGMSFNDESQLALMKAFSYNEELLHLPIESTQRNVFYYNNGSFCSGDAEFWYSIIRHFKPRKIIEIGSGFSTLLAIEALKKNKIEDPEFKVEHICIEPYEQSWLESTNATIIREKVEDVNKSLFSSLNKNDILFIDSSHIIRPQGDVLMEYLEILPVLNSGVIIHIHDIFTPRDYPAEWIFKEHKLWNEQYLLEAFLTLNSSFEIIGALNYLAHKYPNEFSAKCPVFARQSGREPGSFWIRKS